MMNQPTEPEFLTDGEHDVLVGLERAILRYGNPSIREIAECVGRDPSSVHRYLRRLELKGHVRLATRRFRSIQLLEPAPREVGA